MARDKGVETQVLSLASTDKYATFEGGIQRIALKTDTDCYVDFDEVAISGSSFLLKSADNPLVLDVGFSNIQTVHAVGTNGKLYIIGMRGNQS